MTLLEMMKIDLKRAMFEHDSIKKNILRVAIGEIEQLQMTSQQGNRVVTDDQAAKILRKLLQSNLEVLENTPEGERKHILESENVILNALLPKQLTQDEIRVKLETLDLDKMPVGKAMGMAMKLFKETGDFVDGNDVKAVIEARANAV
jgi:uncharacterized protein YqeY